MQIELKRSRESERNIEGRLTRKPCKRKYLKEVTDDREEKNKKVHPFKIYARYPGWVFPMQWGNPARNADHSKHSIATILIQLHLWWKLYGVVNWGGGGGVELPSYPAALGSYLQVIRFFKRPFVSLWMLLIYYYNLLPRKQRSLVRSVNLAWPFQISCS